MAYLAITEPTGATESSEAASVALANAVASGEVRMPETHKMAAAITGSTEDKGKNSRLKSAGTTGLESTETTRLGSAGSWVV